MTRFSTIFGSPSTTKLDSGFLQAVFRTKGYFQCEERIEEEAREVLAVFDLGKRMMNSPRNLPYGLQRKLEIVGPLSESPSSCCWTSRQQD